MENNLTRAFIALDMPEPIKDQIYSLYQIFFRKYTPYIKWEKRENIHVTLKFLGYINDEKIIEVKNILVTLKNNFNVIIHSYGVFPMNKTPRVFWIGLEEKEKKLEETFEQLENALEKIGFAKEQRRFVPHITIARLKIRDKNELKQFEKIKQEFDTEFNQLNKEVFQINAITLFKSELTPKGSIYTKIFE